MAEGEEEGKERNIDSLTKSYECEVSVHDSQCLMNVNVVGHFGIVILDCALPLARFTLIGARNFAKYENERAGQ